MKAKPVESPTCSEKEFSLVHILVISWLNSKPNFIRFTKSMKLFKIAPVMFSFKLTLHKHHKDDHSF